MVAVREYWYLIAFIFLFASVFALGWQGNELYSSYSYQRTINGFYMENSDIDRVRDYQNRRDKYGDWVAVNIRGMDYETAVNTCNHEVGHEIFAEFCEDNMNKCIGLVDDE